MRKASHCGIALPDHLKFFQEDFVLEKISKTYHELRSWSPPWGEGHFLRPVDLRIRNKNFRKSEVSIFIPINWFAI